MSNGIGRFYALTTLNEQQDGWKVVLARASGTPQRKLVEEQARESIGPASASIEADTQQKNLVVVSSTMLKAYGWSEGRLCDELIRLQDDLEAF